MGGRGPTSGPNSFAPVVYERCGNTDNKSHANGQEWGQKLIRILTTCGLSVEVMDMADIKNIASGAIEYTVGPKALKITRPEKQDASTLESSKKSIGGNSGPMLITAKKSRKILDCQVIL